MGSGQSRRLPAKRWPIVFGVGVAIAIVAVTVVHNIRGAGTPATRLAAIEAPAAVVVPQPRPPRRNAAPVQAAGAAVNPAGPPGSVVAAINARRNARRREASARVARMREIAAARFAKEARDPAWASAQARTLADIAKGLSAAGVDSPADLATRCKRTVCRTTATFETASQADQWVLLYMASVGNAAKDSFVSRSRDAQGAVQLDIYSVSER